MHRVGERPRGARPAGSTPRRALSRLRDGLRATGAATLRLELPAEPRLLPPISGCSQRRSSNETCGKWHAKLMTMRASENIPGDDVRQLKLELSEATDQFHAKLESL